MTHSRHSYGFTIAELITVLAVIGVLASVALPVARFGWRRQKEIELRARLAKITWAIDRYAELRAAGVIKTARALGQDVYPRTLDELTEPIELIDGKRVHLLRQRDLVDPIIGTATWQTRSSSDDENSVSTNGDNVWEIHSTSTTLSLDGQTRYSEW